MDECPRYGSLKKDTKYVLLCQGVQDLWEVGMTSLEDWMEKALTCPDIIKNVSGELRAWRQDQEDRLPLKSVLEGVNEAEEYHHRIGWYSNIEGGFSHRLT